MEFRRSKRGIWTPSRTFTPERPAGVDSLAWPSYYLRERGGKWGGLYKKPVTPEESLRTIAPWEARTTGSFRPLCIIFTGRRGQGKTLGMTCLAGFQWLRYRINHLPFQVCTNYKVDFAEVNDPYLIDRLIEYPEWAWRKLVLIDEVAAAFPSRRSMTHSNVLFSNFLTQIRKRAIEVMFTTQFPQVLDTQVLLQIDLVMECEIVGRPPKAINIFVYDFWGQWTGRNWTKRFPPEWGTHDWEIGLTGVDGVFPYFETAEVIAPMASKRRDQMIQREGWIDPAKVQLNRFGDLELPEEQPREPATVEELVSSLPEQFKVDQVLRRAQQLDPSIKGRRHLVLLLRQMGYTVESTDERGVIASR